MSPLEDSKKGACGFTLLEVVLVMALMGIVGALTIPNLFGILRKDTASTAAEKLADALKYAQDQAITNNQSNFIGSGINVLGYYLEIPSSGSSVYRTGRLLSNGSWQELATYPLSGGALAYSINNKPQVFYFSTLDGAVSFTNQNVGLLGPDPPLRLKTAEKILVHFPSLSDPCYVLTIQTSGLVSVNKDIIC